MITLTIKVLNLANNSTIDEEMFTLYFTLLLTAAPINVTLQ